jgi:ankyrin repeat protein
MMGGYMNISKRILRIIAILIMCMSLSACSVIDNITEKVTGTDADKKLLCGIEYNNIEAINEAIEEGAHINKMSGITVGESNPIMYAFKESKTNVEEYLIKRGADVNYADKEKGVSLLMNMAYNCDSNLCRLLIKKGAKVNKTDNYGDTALDYAVKTFKTEKELGPIVTMLADNGAKFTTKTLKNALKGGRPADNIEGDCRYGIVRKVLKEAIRAGYKSGIESAFESAILGDSSRLNWLINHNKIKKKYKKQILFYTAAFGKPDTMKNLKNKGLWIDYVTNNDDNFLFSIAAQYGNLDMVKYLISIGEPINRLNYNHESALLLAVRNNQYDVAKWLIKNKASIKPVNFDSGFIRDVLTEASLNGNIKMIKLILANGYTINKTRLNNAMNVAYNEGKTEALEYFLHIGGDINMKAHDLTLIDSPSSREDIMFLINHGFNIKGYSLVGPASAGDIKLVKYLMNKGISVNTVSDGQESALMSAVVSGHLEMVKLLIKNGAHLEYKCADENNDTVVITAAGLGSRHILEYLIKKGSDINYQNKKGETALMRSAANYILEDNVKVLLKHKANKSLKNKKGKTALDIAKAKGNKDIINALENDK